MDYIQLTFSVSEDYLKEALIAFLSDHQFLGFEEQEDAVIAYVPGHQFNKSIFDNSFQKPELFRGISYEIKEVAEQNWNSIWESSFDPVIIENKIGIRASFHDVLNTTFEMVIDPKMSFGTGHHATTEMMMKLMLQLDFNEKSILDVGSGSGILSVLASMMGARKVLAMDNEENAFNNCRENMKLNQVTNIEPMLADDLQSVQGSFDMILMNINKNTILRFADVIHSKLLESGLLLVSGFLDQELEEIIEKLESNHLRKVDAIFENNWVAASFTKN